MLSLFETTTTQNWEAPRKIDIVATIIVGNSFSLTLSLWYKIQSIDLQSKSMDWVLYDRDYRHDRAKLKHRSS